MKSRVGTISVALLVLALSFSAFAKERIKTDGKNPKVSPIKVTKLDFSDGGGSSVVQPDLYPIMVSATIQNTSKEDELKNVVFHLQLKNGADDVLQDFTKTVGALKPGASFSYDADPYYNYNRIPLHADVLVEHDPIEKKPGATPTPGSEKK
ncbi:MAG: hypothetical protein HY319_12935 [Armatimonadetes bacterium]|nr:hypothetical protein [Armatimonadota bacterium]